MKLIPPNELALSTSSTTLLNDLDELKTEIEAARPLDEEVVRRVEQELLGDRVYSSASIEGNTHTLRETNRILSSGQIVDVGRRREGQEVLNLGSAIDFVRSLIASGAPIADESNLIETHRILLADIDDGIAGQYRKERVMISGAKYQPPRFEDVPRLMAELFESLSSASKIHPVVLAAWVHWAITRIHPFLDGNGRIARLWQDYILLSDQFTPAVIPQSQRKLYYSSLQQAEEGDLEPIREPVYAVTRYLNGACWPEGAR